MWALFNRVILILEGKVPASVGVKNYDDNKINFNSSWI